MARKNKIDTRLEIIQVATRLFAEYCPDWKDTDYVEAVNRNALEEAASHIK